MEKYFIILNNWDSGGGIGEVFDTLQEAKDYCSDLIGHYDIEIIKGEIVWRS